MTLSVKGKHAVITGAGSGINLAFARLLLSKGCSVLIADLQLRPESQALLDQYPQQTSSSTSSNDNKEPFAVFHKTNVASWPQLTSLWSRALSLFPTVDIVVPGAGLFEPQWSSFWDAPRTATNPDSASRDPADAETGHYAVLDVNLTHPIRLSQLAIGHWTQRRQKGCIVFIGSIAGYTSAISTPMYFASKHGLHGFVRSLGGLRDTLGIRVGCIAPGSVRTPMWAEDPSKAIMIDERSPWIEPEEIAEAMYELATDEELGNGTVYEVALKGKRRIIPEFGVEPPGSESFMPGYIDQVANVFRKLKHEGLKI